ncbi:MAG: hypothetical protein Q8M03_03145 [Legionella sp.]|nr:hypothetical protein [Legionella sp.]
MAKPKALDVTEQTLDIEALSKAVKHIKSDFESQYKKIAKTHKKTSKPHGLASEELDDIPTPADNTADDEASSSSCCASVGSCVSWSWSFFTSIKIPQEYIDITEWLGSLAIKDKINSQIVVTALVLSAQYASRAGTGNDIAVQAFQFVIQQFKDGFNLDIDVNIDPSPEDLQQLQNYCVENKITIPNSIKNIINESVEATSALVPA